MRKFFGTSAAARAPIPESKRSAGAEGDEEFFGQYFNQAIYETQTDYVIGTTTQLTTGHANVKIGTGSTFLDAYGGAVVFAQGDRIAIIGHDALDADLAFTANDLVFMMNPGVTIDQNSAYKTTISGLNCRGNLNFSNAFASSIVVGDTTSLLDIQTDLDGSVLALGNVVVNGNLYNDGNHENLLHGLGEVAQAYPTGAIDFTAGYYIDGFYIEKSGGTANLTRTNPPAPVGSKYATTISYAAANTKVAASAALQSEIVKTIQGKTVTANVLVAKGSIFNADMTLRIQKNATPDTMTSGTWADIGSTTIANANIEYDGSGWSLITVTATIPDDGTAEGVRWRLEPTSSGTWVAGGSGEAWDFAQPDFYVGAGYRPFVALDYDENVRRCEYYYWRRDAPTTRPVTIGFVETTLTYGYAHIGIVPRMRITPTISGSVQFNGPGGSTGTIASIAYESGTDFTTPFQGATFVLTPDTTFGTGSNTLAIAPGGFLSLDAEIY